MIATILGSSGSTPTKDRNLISVNVNFNGRNYLFDCGEGTQRQLMKAKISYMKIPFIFFSHFHGDHFLGLPGLLATMSSHQRDYPLTVFGPKGIEEKVETSIKLGMLDINFEVKAKELKEGIIVKEENYSIEAFKLKHRTECFGFVFKEKDKEGEFQREKALKLGIPIGPLFSKLVEGKSITVNGKTISPEQVIDFSKKRIGKKIAIVYDTLPIASIAKHVKEVDLLIHESTFLEENKSRAKETMHSTALDAAKTAAKANAKKLVLFHFSARIKDTTKFEVEARKEFPNVIAAKDLEEIEI